MNKMLYKCKDLVMQLEFVPSDPKLAHIKKSLISFGIAESSFPQAWKTIK
jgi:alpha-glucan,water dikinase